jgi:hypothetical protein
MIVCMGASSRSFPRKREPSFCGKAWVPASAGTSGFDEPIRYESIAVYRPIQPTIAPMMTNAPSQPPLSMTVSIGFLPWKA